MSDGPSNLDVNKRRVLYTRDVYTNREQWDGKHPGPLAFQQKTPNFVALEYAVQFSLPDMNNTWVKDQAKCNPECQVLWMRYPTQAQINKQSLKLEAKHKIDWKHQCPIVNSGINIQGECITLYNLSDGSELKVNVQEWFVEDDKRSGYCVVQPA